MKSWQAVFAVVIEADPDAVAELLLVVVPEDVDEVSLLGLLRQKVLGLLGLNINRDDNLLTFIQ